MAYSSSNWANWRTNPSVLEDVKKELDKLQGHINTGYQTIQSIFDIAQTGIGIVQGALDALASFGLSPFDENPNLLESILKIIFQGIEILLNLIDGASGHFLNLFEIQDPIINTDTLQPNSYTWGEFYNSIKFHTLNDTRDAGLPRFRSTNRVGGLLLLAHTTQLQTFYELYKALIKLFNPIKLQSLSLENSIDKITNFPVYQKVDNAKFDRIVSGNKYVFSLELSAEIDFTNSSNEDSSWDKLKEDMIIGNIIHSKATNGVFKKNINFNPNNDTKYTLKVKVTDGTGGASVAYIPKGTILNITVIDDGKKETIPFKFPDDEEFEVNTIFYSDDKGNAYRDMALAIPWKVIDFKTPIPPETDGGEPPDWEYFRIRDLIPSLDSLYNWLVSLRSFVFTLPKTIADELQDIIDAFQLWLDSIKEYVDTIKEFLDKLNDLQGILETDGLYALYVEGWGTADMVNEILRAGNVPKFGRGYYGGIFLVGHANVLGETLDLLGLSNQKVLKIKEPTDSDETLLGKRILQGDSNILNQDNLVGALTEDEQKQVTGKTEDVREAERAESEADAKAEEEEEKASTVDVDDNSTGVVIEDGKPVYDENGNLENDGTGEPLLDENGTPVLDENGNPRYESEWENTKDGTIDYLKKK